MLSRVQVLGHVLTTIIPWRRSAFALLLVALSVAAGAAVGYRGGGQATSSQATSSTRALRSNQSQAIIDENANLGSAGWILAPNTVATKEIQAYASAPSVLPGQSLTFYTSVKQDGTPYQVDIYRLGWYGGLGGRLLSTSRHIGDFQGHYDPVANKLIDCPTCRTDTSTGLVEAHWRPSFHLTIPSTWLSGVYLAKFTDDNGNRTYTTFDVRGRPDSQYVVVTPDTTVAAYNQWGGYSLYRGPDNSSATRAVKVSLDRPLAAEGASQGLPYWINAIRWLESQGYDVSYISDIDLHEHPDQLLKHRAYISLGHDEYWTKEMRDGVEQARNSSVGLAFLGANDAYWQMRFEPDSLGAQDRTVVCYKDASRDPLFGLDNSRVTTHWRDQPVNRPENALIGIMFSNYSDGDIGFPWHLTATTANQPLPLLQETGLRAGQQYGCALVGYEWDRTFDNGATPAGLQVLTVSRTGPATANEEGGSPSTSASDVSNSTYYIAQSGTLVFATGSIYWTFSLDSLRLQPVGPCAQQDPAVPEMQRLMANVMDALVIKHPHQ
ncbi:MAG: N,N-dimethylformamidase beta subunit family domain-containing protein [Ktedonobacterales bacterium]